MDCMSEAVSLIAAQRQSHRTGGHGLEFGGPAGHLPLVHHFPGLGHRLGTVRVKTLMLDDILGIRPGMTRSTFHHYAQQTPGSMRLRVGQRGAGHQAVTGLAGVAGFKPIAGVPAEEELIPIDEYPLRTNLPVSGNAVRLLAANLVDERDFQRRTADHSQIVRAGVVIRVVQPVRVHEVGIAAPQRLRFGVHPTHEFGGVTGHAIGDGDAGIVGGVN